MPTPNLRFVLAALAAAVGLTKAVHAQLADFAEMVRLPVPNDNWVWLGAPAGDASRVMAMEGGGTIRQLDITRDAGGAPVFTLRTTPFLSPGNVSRQARSVAFAPDYPTSGRFYVAAERTGSDAGTEIVEYTRSATDPNVADPASKRVVWILPELTFDHAVGSMHFGSDGFLYIGLGDDFISSNSPSLTSPFGKFVRIDVRAASGDDFPSDPDRNFAIPPANPLFGSATSRPEIWAIGLRNPWRWSFDRWPANAQGDLWIFDVGGSNAGEVNRVAGNGGPLLNYGWPLRDGTTGTSPIPPGVTLVTPVFSIQRQSSQCSTSGGVRYRGSEIRPWRGRVFYSDACEGGLRTGRLSGDGLTLLDVQQLGPQLNLRGQSTPTSVGSVSMVAEDGVGELYILQASRGASGNLGIFRLVPSANQPAIADIAGPGGAATPDGEFTADDLIRFVGLFTSGSADADFAGPGQSAIVDQELTADDVIVFLSAFFAGR